MRLGLIFLFFFPFFLHAQRDSANKDFLKVQEWQKQSDTSLNDDMDLDALLGQDENNTVKVKNAFKSTRVINGHSMEMLGKGVLDFRILHRFGSLSGGLYEMFGLDAASMRMGFDYGVGSNVSVGIGRSTLKKELDGFIKYQLMAQKTGKQATPLSIIYIAGMSLHTLKHTNSQIPNYFTSRMAFYHQIIFGRKFSQSFSAQISPIFLHRNLVEFQTDPNDLIALGIGGRIKLNKRIAFLIDAHPIFYGARPNYNKTPLSIGFDIETGGHVFQLHFSNAKGMNETAFLSNTTQQWAKREIHFGFNLSRVFTIKKNKSES